ncbi:MAG: glutaminyl-peptide cyclotransferase [Ferruginibacter sp.]|nr:glutaminyl-peptide cyclotransferase [Ferruginibacter sp.]
MKNILPFTLVVFLFISCNDDDKIKEVPNTISTSTTTAVKIIPYTIIAQYPHDTASYTEGLEFYNGKLYESGGDFANSVLQLGDAKTGKIEKKNKMGTATTFAEGITILNGKLYQLTWQTHDVFVYDVKDITKVIKKFTWPYDGWGLTNNGTDLILTTGGSDLYFVNPETFAIKNTVHIHDNAGPVDSVNELEYVNGFVWGNIYETNDIIKIDPQTGAIVGKMNFDKLLDPMDRLGTRAEVFNGIAYDSTAKTFFVTGKRWPKMFEIRVN